MRVGSRSFFAWRDFFVVFLYKGFFIWNCVDFRVCGGYLYICFVFVEGRLVSEGVAVIVYVFIVVYVFVR